MTQLTSQLRWGFIGAGQIARTMATDLALTESNRLVSVASRSYDTAAALARTFSASPKRSVGEILDDSNIDVVYIATPPATHADLAIAALRAGKHVLVEKPLATSVFDAERIAAAAAVSGMFCMEAMWTRFLPSIIGLIDDVRTNKLGDITSFIADFSYSVQPSTSHHLFQPDGGGVLLDRAVYGIAVSHALFGAPQSVTAKVRRNAAGVDVDVALLLTHKDVSSSITASAVVTGTNEAQIRGSLATVTLHEPFFGATRVTHRFASPQVLGLGASTSVAERFLDLPVLAKPKIQSSLSRAKGFAKAAARERNVSTSAGSGAGYSYQLNAVADAIEQGCSEDARWTLHDSVAVLRVIEQARSAS